MRFPAEGTINQPTGARNYQAVFWNIAYYDKPYFESLFGNFYFPDGTQPDWEGLSWLQKRFMKWFNKERTKTVLTFPVETMALLSHDGDVIDKEWGDFTAEMYSEGHSFFTYMSDNADSLSSCCRLRNEIQDNGFSYTLGAGGVSTGSKSVLTVNLNRCIQYAINNKIDSSEPAAVASPMGKSVSGKSFEVRYTPGMRTSAIAEMLWINDISERPQAQKYPLKQKCIPAKSASQM